MGTTSDSWSVGGALAVTGTTEFTGAQTFTGAAAFSSTVDVTGTATFDGAVTAGDSTAALAMDETDYSWFYCDGTNRPAFNSIQLYDWGTGAMANVYLENGTIYT